MQFLEIRSKVKNHHISEAGVSFENIVWSVYQDMGWRIHFLHMAVNCRLKAIGEVIFAVCKIKVGGVISHHLRFKL